MNVHDEHQLYLRLAGIRKATFFERYGFHAKDLLQKILRIKCAVRGHRVDGTLIKYKLYRCTRCGQEIDLGGGYEIIYPFDRKGDEVCRATKRTQSL